MALTFSEIVRSTIGHKRLVVTKCTMDSAYTTGGKQLTPSNVSMLEILAIVGDGANGYTCTYDKPTQKLKAYTTAGTEAAASANLSTVAFTLLIIGT